MFCWQTPTVSNFGDLLGVPLLARYSNVKATVTDPWDADIVVCGSVLRLLPEKWKGIILGTGSLGQQRLPDLSQAKILAVRGPRTAHALKRTDLILGDPGFLAPGLLKQSPKRVRKLVVAPHWSDNKLEGKYPEASVLNLRVSASATVRIIREIGMAQQVVTSSLHAFLVALAFGIPAMAFPHGRTSREGGDWKWHDALAPIGMKHVWGEWVEAPRQAVEEVQGQLRQAFAAVTDG